MYLVEMFKFCLTTSGFSFLIAVFLAPSKPSLQWHGHSQDLRNLADKPPIKTSKCWKVSASVKLHFCENTFVQKGSSRVISRCCNTAVFGILLLNVTLPSGLLTAEKDLKAPFTKVCYSASTKHKHSGSSPRKEFAMPD